MNATLGVLQAASLDASSIVRVVIGTTPALKFHSASRLEGDHTTYGQIYGVYYAGPSILNPFVPGLGDGQSYVPRSLFAYDARYRSFDSDNSLQLDLNTSRVTQRILVGVDYSWFRQLSQQAFDYLTVKPIDVYNPVYTPGITADYGPITRQVLVAGWSQNCL